MTASVTVAMMKIITSESFSLTIRPLFPVALMNTLDFKDRLDTEWRVLFQLWSYYEFKGM